MTDNAPSERPAPANVIQALARVMEELPGIGRNERSQQGYNYRGIEAITREASSLLGRYGVVFVPKVLERKTIDLTVNGKPWTEDHATILYTVYGPGGIEDRIEVGPLIALGRDNSDKGMNKCMTQAFKYALLQTLCIGDAKDDADAHAAAESDARPSTAAPPKTGGWDSAEHEAQAHKDIAHRLAQLPEDHPVRIAGRVMREKHGWPVALERLAELRNLLDEAETPSATHGNDEKAPSPSQTPESPSEAPAPAPEPLPLPEPDPTTMALIAFVEGLRGSQIGDALEARNAALSGAPKVRQQRLAKLLAGEGWTPGRGHLPEPTATVPPGSPEPVCTWCGHRERTDPAHKDERVENGTGGWMHPSCRVEWEADKNASEEPF